MKASPFDAVQDAIQHMRQDLFPFRFQHWLALGFIAFLDQCGRSGGGGNAPGRTDLPFPKQESGGTEHFMRADPDIEAAVAWLGSHVGLVAAIAVGGLLLIAALMALATWLGSRGIFMYLDAVVRGRAEIGRAWNEHAARAWSLFAWRFVLAMVALASILLILAAGGLLVLQVQRGALDSGTGLAIGLVVLLPLFLLLVLGLGLFSVLLRDFAAPLQWLHGFTCSEAVTASLGLVRGNVGGMVLYVLLKFVFAILLVTVGMLAGCLTCCIGFLPVVSQTILQPLHYFERGWSLHFLRRLGHDLMAAVPRA